NTRTLAYFSQHSTPAEIAFLDPATGLSQDFKPATGWMTINPLSPDELERLQERSRWALTYPEVLQEAGLDPASDLLRITESTDRGTRRYDLNLADPARPLPRRSAVRYGLLDVTVTVPLTIFVDTETNLVREYQSR